MESKSAKSTTQKNQKADPHIPGMAWTIFGILLTAAILGALLMDGSVPSMWIGTYVTVLLLIATYVLYGLKIASQCEKAVVLRLGKFRTLRGPGVFWIIPIVDSIQDGIDHRVMVTPFSAEKTLTKDTVPVDVDAVLFWVVWDAEKAALKLKDYQTAIAWTAQTALRDTACL